VREQPYNQKSDIWSLGVVLHVMLTRCYPFMDKNFEMTKLQILEKVLTPNSQKIKKLPPAVQEVLLKMLEKIQETRPSIQDLIQYPWIRHLRKKIFNIT
jgi:serine/threonine protein kinase